MAKTIQGFDTRLKEAMHLKGMKQVELSEKTGIGKSSISHYMSGTHSPTTDALLTVGVFMFSSTSLNLVIFGISN